MGVFLMASQTLSHYETTVMPGGFCRHLPGFSVFQRESKPWLSNSTAQMPLQGQHGRAARVQHLLEPWLVAMVDFINEKF